jgi:hypothetical protein
MPRKTLKVRLEFWLDHASCDTIKRMAAEVGLEEGTHGCLPLILGEVPERLRKRPRHLARMAADTNLDRSISNALRIEKLQRKLEAQEWEVQNSKE